jgi:hypothetical protein
MSQRMASRYAGRDLQHAHDLISVLHGLQATAVPC